MAPVATAIYIAVLSGVGLWFIHKERVAQKREGECASRRSPRRDSNSESGDRHQEVAMSGVK
jgi:hypothetical protein